MKIQEVEQTKPIAIDDERTAIAERLRQARKDAGYRTAADAARAMGISPVTYTSHENGTRNFTPKLAEKYGKHFGVKPEAILYDMNDDDPVTGSLGPQIDESIIDELELPDDFLQTRLRIQQGGARMLEVEGDYMYDPSCPSAAGSLLPGDRVIVDIHDRKPSPPGAFAVYDGAGVTLKLIEVVPNSAPLVIRITGRNPRYENFERPASDVAIIGRVKAKVSML